MRTRRNQNKFTAIALSLLFAGAVFTTVSVLMLTGVIHAKGPDQPVDTVSSEVSSSEETLPPPSYDPNVDLCEVGVHYPITIVGEPATCYAPGMTDKIVCEKCGFTLKGSEETPLGNHARREVKEICLQSNVGCAFPAFFHCPDCGENFYDTLLPSDFHMPIVNILGSTSGADLMTKVRMGFEYYGEDQEFEADMLLKFQGQSSYLYDKKNFSVALYEKGTNYQKKQKVTLFEGHKESKYCLKANFVDASAGRNIIAARLYKQIASTRNLEDDIAKLDTKGVIDGFPVLLYQNGHFLGLYTLNMPRDKWVYDMHDSETTREAALFSRKFEATNRLRAPLTAEAFDIETLEWKLEYASTEDFPRIGTQWVLTSFNNVISMLNTMSDADLKKYLPNFVNIDRTIDVLIYTMFLNCYDNRCKNNLYLTYDGAYWTPTMYDMDSTFSLNFNGENFLPYDLSPDNISGDGTVLFAKVKKLWWPEMVARYKELRASVLTYENVQLLVDEWFNAIPAVCFKADFARNPSIPQHNIDHRTQILGFTGQRLTLLDKYFR